MEHLHLSNPLPAVRSHHSFTNAVHVVHVQLQLLGRLSGRKEALRSVLELCREATAASDDGKRLPAIRNGLESFSRAILRAVAAVIPLPVDERSAGLEELHEVIDLLLQGLVLAEARVQELLSSARVPVTWADVSVADFVAEIQRDVALLTVGRRWDVVFSKDQHGGDSYLVAISVMSPSVDRVSLPPAVSSLLSYLVLGALQRTKPGGVITVAVVDDGQAVAARVQDLGRGIPLESIDARVSEIIARGESENEATHLLDAALAALTILAARSDGVSFIDAVPGGETVVGLSIHRSADGGVG